MSIEQWWNDNERGKQNTGRGTCHSDTLSITGVTFVGLGSNPVFRGERPATDRLNRGAAFELNFI